MRERIVLAELRDAATRDHPMLMLSDQARLLALVEAVEAVRDVIDQDLFPNPACPDGLGCFGCLEDAMEGKRRLREALRMFDFEAHK